ncbi:hypothetical protein ACNKHU_11640 [Shigella flexneri]
MDGNTIEYDGMTMETCGSPDGRVCRCAGQSAVTDAIAASTLPGLPPGTV